MGAERLGIMTTTSRIHATRYRAVRSRLPLRLCSPPKQHAATQRAIGRVFDALDAFCTPPGRAATATRSKAHGVSVRAPMMARFRASERSCAPAVRLGDDFGTGCPLPGRRSQQDHRPDLNCVRLARPDSNRRYALRDQALEHALACDCTSRPPAVSSWLRAASGTTTRDRVVELASRTSTLMW